MTSFKWFFKTHYKKKWKFSDLRNQAKVDLVLHALVFDWFLSLIKNKSGSYRAVFIMYTLMNGFLLFFWHLTPRSFCTQGLPGVAESTASWMQGKPSPQGKGARYGGWGVMERVLPRSSLIIYDGFPTPGGQGWSFRWWILQLCLRLRAEWQSVRHIAKSESFRTRETKQKWVWYYMHWFLIDFCFW